MSDWDSNQYVKFINERTQPTVDLISRLDISPKSILDIGCGPGNSTAALKRRFENADITGVDASDDMLNKARNTYPGIKFLKAIVPQELDLAVGGFDLIFSNACIHWIDGQDELIRALYKKLNRGGTVAVQIPLVQKAPFYQTLYRLVESEKWKKLSDINNFHNLTPEGYFDLLALLADDFTIWETVYYHRVPSYESVIEWYSGSGLRPYLDRLQGSEKEEFICELSGMIKNDYKFMKNGEIILKMPRLFFIAKRKPLNARCEIL